MFTFNEDFRHFRDILTDIAIGDLKQQRELILSIKQLDDNQSNYEQLGKFITLGEGIVLTFNLYKINEDLKSEILRILSVCSIKNLSIFENIHKKTVDNN